MPWRRLQSLVSQPQRLLEKVYLLLKILTVKHNLKNVFSFYDVFLTSIYIFNKCIILPLNLYIIHGSDMLDIPFTCI